MGFTGGLVLRRRGGNLYDLAFDLGGSAVVEGRKAHSRGLADTDLIEVVAEI